MKTVQFSATNYYSLHQLLRAAQQLIGILRQDHERGLFELAEVKLRSGDTDLVFTGTEYLAFAERGIQEALAMTKPRRTNSPANEADQL
jgi:4-alpha-glucanotransferase